MISIRVVDKCPYTEVGIGVIQMSQEVIGVLAGAVHDKNEWIALLVGTRSTDGLEVSITDIRIPLQERSHSSCELARPEPLADDIVGVIHSHHSMGAFFSQTDINTLNPRFPLSLVVAHMKPNSTKEELLLGFSYLAEGRATLPCSTPGLVGYTIVPNPVLPDWEVITPGFSEPNESIGLYDCPHTTKTHDNRVTHCTTHCGITKSEPRQAIFGKNGKTFLDEVQQKTQPSKWFNNQGINGNQNVRSVAVIDNRKYFDRREAYGMFTDGEEYDERYLRHWGL